MRQKLKASLEFQLPENFSGGFIEAMKLYVEYCEKSWDNQPKYPATLPEDLCFPWALRQGGEAYTCFSIESFKFESLDEEMDYDEQLQEEMEDQLCSGSDQ